MTNLVGTFEKPSTQLTPQQSLDLMKITSSLFYNLAANTQCHAFLEFTGLLNEYIKICEENLVRGIDFRQENVHTGNTGMTIQPYQVDYMNEKLECIFQGLIRMQQAKKPE